MALAFVQRRYGGGLREALGRYRRGSVAAGDAVIGLAHRPDALYGPQ